MLRLGEIRSAYIGLACGAIGFTGYAFFATQGWMIYSWMAVFVFIGLSGPAINAIMSRQVGPTEQGELQGALASLGSLTSEAAPPPFYQSLRLLHQPGGADLFSGRRVLCREPISRGSCAVAGERSTRPAAASGHVTDEMRAQAL